MNIKSSNNRLAVLDLIRGTALISMIAYHTIWDLVSLFSVSIPWFKTDISSIWQLSICCTFIMLSGFCCSLGCHRLKRGLVVFMSGWIITVATAFFMPDELILFGVLTLIGSCMLIMIALDRLFKRCSPVAGLIICMILFIIIWNINLGNIGIGSYIYKLPHSWYRNTFTAFLGFPAPSFSSSDYFPLLPWIFLFMSGYFLFGIFKKYGLLRFLHPSLFEPLQFIGRHSLIIYMIHQPVIYLILNLLL